MDNDLINPVGGAFEITPHDTNVLPKMTRAIYVGASGDLAVTMINGNDITFVGLAGGVFHPMRVSHVKSTNTTATGIIGAY